MNRNDKCSSISIVALILEVMIQILSVFSVKLTSALEIYHQKHRRTGRGGGGGGGGAAAPSKFWATQIFWAVRENLSKASFKRRFHVYVIILKRELFSKLTAWSRRNITRDRDSGWLARDEFLVIREGYHVLLFELLGTVLHCTGSNALFPVVNWLE